MAAALYGDGGFFVRPGNPPAAHFRTSAHTSTLLASALLRLLDRLDRALHHPDPLTVVDVGAGRGELLAALRAGAPAHLADRLHTVAVELAPPPGQPGQISWRRDIPDRFTGLLLATEWLDNVPIDVAQVDPHGVVRYVQVASQSGQETLGPPVTGEDAAWLARWWPLLDTGTRAEIGLPRDRAWQQAVAAVSRGLALTVDYGHLATTRPRWGTLTGFRAGRQVTPVPDGSCDVTAHVAIDAVAEAGRAPAGIDPVLVTQATALQRLGVHGARPARAMASQDPLGYLRRLALASAAAELTEPAGLGGHYWLAQPIGLPAGERLLHHG